MKMNPGDYFGRLLKNLKNENSKPLGSREEWLDRRIVEIKKELIRGKKELYRRVEDGILEREEYFQLIQEYTPKFTNLQREARESITGHKSF
jgi:hypothetical protein